MVALASASTAFAAAPPHALTEALQRQLARAAAEHPEIPGIALAIFSPGRKERWSGAAGKTAIGGAEALTPDHPFRIASITKVFVAATILRLHEQGRLAVTEPILPYIAPQTGDRLRRGGHDPATIRIDHLLTHSSGMADHTTAAPFLAATLGKGGHRWTRAEQLEILASQQRPVAPPGTAFHYSDTGYVLLGEIIERVTGETLAAAVRREMQFARLRLDSTWWEGVERAPSHLKPRARQYQGRTDVTDLDPSFDLFGGGGLVSTTDDLARFFAALLTGQLFDRPQTLALALAAPNIDPGPRRQIHALVPFIVAVGDHLCWQHGGHWGSMALYCPDLDLAIAYTVNQNESSLYRDLLHDLAGLIDGAPAWNRRKAAISVLSPNQAK